MKNLGHLGRGLVLAAATLVGSATTAHAAPMLFTLEGASDSTLSASVLFTYVGLTETSGRVDVDVTNTSSVFDPRLTGFAFNVPGVITGVSSFSSSLSGWEADFDPDDINSPGQFGFFDTAALTGSNLNGGSPNLGIARGVTATFSFTLAGSGMMGLTESSFLSLLSDDPQGGPNEAEQYFIGRFQRTGLLGSGSDVAIPDGEPTTTTAVPEPTTLLLSGLGLLGLGAMGRRRRQA